MLLLASRPRHRLLVDYDAGVFTRNSVASYQIAAPSNDPDGFVRSAPVNVPRYENRDDGAGPLLLIEGTNANLFRYSRDLGAPNWLSDRLQPQDCIVTPDYAIGVDGLQKAARLQFSGSISTIYQAYAGLTTGTVQVWMRATSGVAQMNIAMSAAGGPTEVAALGTLSLGETWTFLSFYAEKPAGWQAFSPADSKNRTIAPPGGVAVALPQDILIDYAGATNQRFPRATLWNTTNSDFISPADSLTYLTGSYPTRLLTERAEFSMVSPEFASTGTDLTALQTRYLLCFGVTGNDGVRFQQTSATEITAQVIVGGVVMASSQPIVCARHALLGPVSWDPAAGRIYVNGIPGPVGTPWVWPGGQTMRVGGIVGAGTELTGRIGNLQVW